jgi:hypothetical protein
MNNIVITIVLVLGLFLFVVFLTNTITIYAQQQMPPSSSNTLPPQIPSQSPSSTSPKAVKIISPTKGQQIPVGKDLTISGTSIDNAISNCQVSMSVNRVRPYQPVTAAGTAGVANDYSKWNFVLTSNYTTIKPGPDNRITAKYTCTDNPAVVSPTYSSVNVTGVMDATPTTITAATTTPAANVLQQKQQTMTTRNNATMISNGNPNKIIPQDKPSLTVGNNNTTPVGNTVSTSPLPPHTASTPTKTPNSDKLLYLGVSSKSANKVDDTNTKSAVAHHSSNDNSGSNDDSDSKVKVHKVRDSSGGSSSSSSASSSNDDNSFDTTTKIKTQHTSSTSDKPTKKTTTITNNISEEHPSINPGSSKAKTSHSSDKSKNSDKPTKSKSTTATAEEHPSINPGSSKAKTSHSSDKSNDGGGVIDSEFGHSDPLSDALDAMSNTLDHLFG